MKKIKLLLPAFILCLSGFSQLPGEVKVTDMLKIKQVGAITLNKVGNKAAYVVTSIEPDGENKTEFKTFNKIFLLSLNGSGPSRQITSSTISSSQPAWSPDGKQIAFVRLSDNKPQIFLLPIDGGEAMQLTHNKYGANNPKWSPDGKWIVCSSGNSLSELLQDSLMNPTRSYPPWSFEKPGFNTLHPWQKSSAKPLPDGSMQEIRSYLEKDEVDKKAIVVNKLNFQDETGIRGDWNFEEFYLIDVVNGGASTLLTKPFSRFNSMDFTPDGNHFIISGNIDSSENPDRVLETRILLSDFHGNNIKTLLAKEGIGYSLPSVSPSGKWLAFQFGRVNTVDIPKLGIISLDETKKDPLIIPFDRSKSKAIWSKDEKSIYFTAQTNGYSPIYKANLASQKTQQLSGIDLGIQAFDIAGNTIVYSQTSISDPSALFTSDTTLSVSTKINLNEWVKDRQISIPEKKSFINEKGETIEYWIMKPYGFKAGKKYPLLLEIHGGPAAMWGPGEATMWHEFQYFCGKGYGVVYCNPRGSGGYGVDFLRANMGDWGAGPSSDVISALEKTVAEGWSDTSKLLITGGSYAGYLVAWIIAHDHRFRAACSQRGVYDLATFFGEGNAWRLVPNYFGGYPWEPRVKELLIRESPITYVQNITTPYIIFHGDNDRRTGFVQGEEMYRSLKVLGRPVEYVRHPGATHEITRSGDNRQRIDQMLRTYEFFERFLH